MSTPSTPENERCVAKLNGPYPKESAHRRHVEPPTPLTLERRVAMLERRIAALSTELRDHYHRTSTPGNP